MCKRVFVEESQEGINQIKIIDMEQGTFTTYFQDVTVGFPFGNKFTQPVENMGYKDAKDCIKKLKARKLLTNEVDYEEQKRSERIGYIKLGIERIKRNDGFINTNCFADICEKLKEYGIGFVDAQNMITAAYLHQ